MSITEENADPWAIGLVHTLVPHCGGHNMLGFRRRGGAPGREPLPPTDVRPGSLCMLEYMARHVQYRRPGDSRSERRSN